MTTTVPIQCLTRSEVDNLALRQQGVIKDLRAAIETRTKPESALRRDMDKIFERFNGKLDRTFGRLEKVSLDARVERQKVQAHDEYWGTLSEPDDGSLRGSGGTGPDRAPQDESHGSPEDRPLPIVQQAPR